MVNKRIDVIAVGTCYVDTNVDNFSFDRSGMVGEELIGGHYEVVAGGSAVNFCRLGQALGLRTAFIGMAGRDSNGTLLQHLLVEQGVQPHIIQRQDLLTNIGFNVTNSQGDHVMFIAGTANAALAPLDVLPKLKQLLPQSNMLYLGGCFKLKAFYEAFDEVIYLADQDSVALIIDHGRIPEGVSQQMLGTIKELVLHSTYYFPSREEFCAVWEVANIEEGLRKLQELAPNLVTVVKDGANGAFYLESGQVYHVKAQRVKKVVNATGAGDSFNAGVMTAVLKSASLFEAVTYACQIAAAKIEGKSLPVFND